jgi:hypothetical protein
MWRMSVLCSAYGTRRTGICNHPQHPSSSRVSAIYTWGRYSWRELVGEHCSLPLPYARMYVWAGLPQGAQGNL